MSEEWIPWGHFIGQKFKKNIRNSAFTLRKLTTTLTRQSISGSDGDSILEPGANMLWFKRQKVIHKDSSTSMVTLLEALD